MNFPHKIAILQTISDMEDRLAGMNGDWKKEGITLEHELSKSGDALTVSAMHPNGNVAGLVEFKRVGNKWEPDSTNVAEEHQRKGIASAMYAHAEKITGMKVTPSDRQTSQAKALWKQKNPSFGKDWFKKKSPESQREYLKLHPSSKQK